MKKIYIILGLAVILTVCQLLFGPAVAKEVVMKIYNYEVTRVIDGDTVAFAAPFLPWKPLPGEHPCALDFPGSWSEGAASRTVCSDDGYCWK